MHESVGIFNFRNFVKPASTRSTGRGRAVYGDYPMAVNISPMLLMIIVVMQSLYENKSANIAI